MTFKYKIIFFLGLLKKFLVQVFKITAVLPLTLYNYLILLNS